MIKIFFSFACLGVIYMFVGCKSNPATQVVYTGSGIPGNMVGKVSLTDTLYDNASQNFLPITDASGVKVSLESTNLSAISGNDGRWEIDNIPPGIYTIVSSKDGFATDKNTSVEFAGNGSAYEPNRNLFRISKITPELVLRGFGKYITIVNRRDTTVSSTDSSGTRTHVVSIGDTIIEPFGQAVFTFKVIDPLNGYEGYFSADIFFGKSENISPLDPKSYSYMTTAYYYAKPSTSGDFTVSQDALLKAGFSSGNKVFCVAYSGKESTGVSYLDLATFKQVYTGLSPNTSGVKNFILP